MRVLAELALGLIGLAFIGTWADGSPYSDDACLKARPTERSTFHAEASLWPPGGQCVIELPNRGERGEAGPVPLFEWSLLAVCMAAVLTVAQLWQRLRTRVDSRAMPE